MEIKLILSGFCFFALSGCATHTLSERDSKDYANLDIYQFTKARFVDKEQEPEIFSLIDSGVSGLTKVVGSNKSQAERDEQAIKDATEKRTTGLMFDGKTIIFKAYYNHMNVRQLKRPRVEVERYCGATGGKFVTNFIDTNNFAAHSYRSPLSAYVEALSKDYDGTVTTTYGNVSITQSINSLKPYIAEADAANVAYVNSSLDIEGASSGYNDAIQAGSFGVFSCIKPDNKPAWHVTISPFSFVPKRAGDDMDSHTLKIVLSPVKD